VTDMPQYFIVKHDLESFTAMLGFIWRTNLPKKQTPIGFRMVKVGDRWVEFAYRKGWDNTEPCSMVTEFYECTKAHWYGQIPMDEGTLGDNFWEARTAEMIKEYCEGRSAHMIQGERCDGYQPRHPVTVPSIKQRIGRTVQPRVAVARIDYDEFGIIRITSRSTSLDASPKGSSRASSRPR
jgi:hypothetical protein